MGEAIIVFIFISWLLVTLLIYWFKQKVRILDDEENIRKEIDKMLGEG